MPETINTQYTETFCNYLISIKSEGIIQNVSILEDANFGKLIINDKKTSFYYFSGENKKISIKIVSDSSVSITSKKFDINIEQIYIAEHLRHYNDDIFLSYPKLVPYKSDYIPAIFYGMWSENDLQTLEKNKSLKIIIWTGGDIYIDSDNTGIKNHVRDTINRIKKLNKVVHIAISKFIEADLTKLGINFLKVPFMGIDLEKFKPVKKGKSIYIYTSPFYGNKYGEELYSKVMNKYKDYNFIITCSIGSMEAMLKYNKENPYGIKYYNKNELIEKIYPQCFIALRLTKHDGLAGTVQELGAMGIKSIHNGDTPSCLHYSTLEDIYKHIDKEILTIDTCDHELSNSVKKYLKLDPLFFNTKFYNRYSNEHKIFNIKNNNVPQKIKKNNVTKNINKQLSNAKSIMEENKYNFVVEKNCGYQISVVSNDPTMLSFVEDRTYGEISIKKGPNIFNYYNGNQSMITIKTKMPATISIKKNNIPIKQIYVSERLREAFQYDLLQTHKLEIYNNDYEPAIFYGIWSKNDLDTLKRNKSLKVIIWTGGDINHNIERTEESINVVLHNVNTIKKLDKIKHISISTFISKSLTELNLSFKEVPFMGIDFDMYKPVKKGKSIYIYTVVGTGRYYGSHFYDKLIKKYKDINFIFACWKNSEEYIKKNNYKNPHPIKYYDKKELVEKIYPQCFLGLRLTVHDGLSATVQELGLMGIKCIHNGNGPNNLNYKTFDDICRHIDNERKTIGLCDYELSEKVKKYLTIDPKFFTTDFHK
ncbi:hypothetical protein QJ856_gp0839 [Tupanvirus deep ocean]|uniref:Uncharacterized protein n=2 Tax=Tupanvirus TaxID=2094720 RepID=A0AC62A807_9VIRU|nr:hypothetical protein QJ856_gp0839 [Tupanvirus deep ocean]QKU33916.1 hypothetical protein [Tupanvirus deep ocean]